MTDTDMTAMCDSAMVRLTHSINRSAGQHMRQMREQHRMTDSEFLSDLLYAGHMGELPESTIAEACERFGIEFPPQPHRYTNEHSMHDSRAVRNRQIHQPAQHQPC